MSNELLSCEEGIEKVESLLPQVVEAEAKDVVLHGVEGGQVQIVVDNAIYTLPRLAQRKFRSETSLDFRMLEELTPEVRSLCWTQLIQDQEDRVFRFKVSDGNIIQIGNAITPQQDYRGLLNRLVTAIKPTHFSNIYNRRERVCFGFVTDEAKAPPKRVDDVLHSGMYVTFNGSATIQPYNMRLVCTNGAITMERKQAYVLNDGNFDGVVGKVRSLTHEFLDKFVHLDEHPVGDAGGIIGRLTRQRVLTTRQAGRVTEELARLGEGATEFDLVNLITELQHERNDSSWLLAGGRTIQHLQGEHCSHCGTAL